MSKLSPPTRIEPLYALPPSAITPTSVVPPPMSTTIDPVASDTGKPAPTADASDSPIRLTFHAPAATAASLIARRSTWVAPAGTHNVNAAEQLARLGAHGRHALLPGGRLLLETHHGRLIQHDAAIVGIDEGIGRTEVHRHGMTEQSIEKRVMRRRSGH